MAFGVVCMVDTTKLHLYAADARHKRGGGWLVEVVVRAKQSCFFLTRKRGVSLPQFACCLDEYHIDISYADVEKRNELLVRSRMGRMEVVSSSNSIYGTPMLRTSILQVLMRYGYAIPSSRS